MSSNDSAASNRPSSASDGRNESFIKNEFIKNEPSSQTMISVVSSDAQLQQQDNDAYNERSNNNNGSSYNHRRISSSGGSVSNKQQHSSNVCRDFLNNVCSRGTRCKFEHPDDLSGAAGGQSEEQINFCNDFQNWRGCARESCRYVHCSREDAETYAQTGRISDSLARAIVAVTGQLTVGGRPLCKEFIARKCTRGVRCRFWHINPREEREMRNLELTVDKSSRAYSPDQKTFNRGDGGVPYPTTHPHPQYAAPYGRSSVAVKRDSSYYDVGEIGGPPIIDDQRPDIKRGRYAGPTIYTNYSQATSRYGATTTTTRSHYSPNYYINYSRHSGGVEGGQQRTCTKLVEDNSLLRKKIDMLKQTLADLKAANEALIGENTHLRAKAIGTAATVTDQALAAASIASAAAINSVLSSSVAGLASQALAPSATATGLTAEQHLAAVSLAAAAQKPAVVVHPSSASSDVVQWSVPQMRL